MRKHIVISLGVLVRRIEIHIRGENDTLLKWFKWNFENYQKRYQKFSSTHTW